MILRHYVSTVMLISWAAVTLSACSAPIHIGQPVEVPAKGEIQVAVGSGVSGSSAAYDLVTAANDKAKELATKQYNCKATDKSDCLPSLQLREMVRGTYAMGLAGTVDVNMEGGGLYGLGNGLAIGGRLSSAGQRVDGLWQFLDGKDASPWRGSLLLGYSHTSGKAPSVIQDVLEFLKIPEASRHSLHLGAQIGQKLGRYGWWQIGPHYLLSRHKFSMTPDVPILDEATKLIVNDYIPNTDTEGWSHHIGGSAALWLGYKPVFVGLELAAAWVKASPTLLGTVEEFSLVQISPNLTILARF